MNDFNFSNVEDFDKHIELSIPNYSTLFNQLRELIDSLDSRGGRILDIGCSTGKLLKALESDSIKEGIDLSSLLPKSTGDIEFFSQDIVNYDFDKYTTIASIFFLQFLTRYERKIVLDKVKDALEEGGRFYCAEKIHYDDAMIDAVTKEIHIQKKREHFTDEEILNKSDQLSRSMWLSTDTQLREELEGIGKVTEIWRSYTFCAYVVTKDSVADSYLAPMW